MLVVDRDAPSTRRRSRQGNRDRNCKTLIKALQKAKINLLLILDSARATQR